MNSKFLLFIFYLYHLVMCQTHFGIEVVTRHNFLIIHVIFQWYWDKNVYVYMYKLKLFTPVFIVKVSLIHPCNILLFP